MYLVYNKNWSGDGLVISSLIGCFDALEDALRLMVYQGEGIVNLQSGQQYPHGITPLLSGRNDMNYWHVNWGFYDELFYPKGITVLYKHYGHTLRIGEIKSRNCKINRETLKPENIQYEIDDDHTIKHDHIQSVLDVKSIQKLLKKLPDSKGGTG